jgi:Amt family ammonium transporter
MRPHNLPLVLLGAGLLWFGWFGFNAGSAVTSGQGAALAFMNTQVATACAALGWIAVEKIRDGHSTTLGVASGAVAGLVAITPACGSINPMGALVLGFVAGAVCAYAVGLKYRFGFDDSLDVVGVHLVGGIVGTLAIGFLATKTAIKATGSLGQGGFWDGNGVTQLGRQALAAVAVLAYSFVIAAILAKIIDKTIGFTVDQETEVNGVDTAIHAESAYEFGTGLGGSLSGTAARPHIASQERIDA